MRILVVEDDKKLSGFLRKVLVEEGFDVDSGSTGPEALSLASGQKYDALVLDWMLPGKDGIEVCADLRRQGNATPILMLTARGETKDRVQGLDTGADDYLVKPFEIDELLARLRALLRRNQGAGKLQAGVIEVDRLQHKAWVKGAALTLTTREFALLSHLTQHADTVVSRVDLLSHVWETTVDPGSNLIEVHISRLREKLGEHAWMIETIRGAGYRLRSR
jgi:DNA-binding response OmpR family regulator